MNMMSVVVQTARTRPDLTLGEIAKLYGIGRNTLWRYMKRAGLKRPHGRKAGWSKSGT